MEEEDPNPTRIGRLILGHPKHVLQLGEMQPVSRSIIPWRKMAGMKRDASKYPNPRPNPSNASM